jgi:hypothetical protein
VLHELGIGIFQGSMSDALTLLLLLLLAELIAQCYILCDCLVPLFADEICSLSLPPPPPLSSSSSSSSSSSFSLPPLFPKSDSWVIARLKIRGLEDKGKQKMLPSGTA